MIFNKKIHLIYLNYCQLNEIIFVFSYNKIFIKLYL